MDVMFGMYIGFAIALLFWGVVALIWEYTSQSPTKHIDVCASRPCCEGGDGPDGAVEAVLSEDDRDLWESIDGKLATLVQAERDNEEALKQVVGRLDTLEKTTHALDGADDMLLGEIEKVQKVVQKHASEIDQLWAEWDDDEFDEDDSDLDPDDSDLEEPSWTDDDEFETDEEEEEEDDVFDTPYLHGAPVLTAPAETLQMQAAGPLPTSLPITVSSADWRDFERWRAGREQVAVIEGAD